VAPLGAFRAVELDHELLTALKVPGQSGAVAAGALDRPGSQSGVLVGEGHKLDIAVSGGLNGDLTEHAAGAGVDCGRGVGVDVGVDADHDIDHLAQIGQTRHCVLSLPGSGCGFRSGRRFGRTVMRHVGRR
jgi:hypothetical protein